MKNIIKFLATNLLLFPLYSCNTHSQITNTEACSSAPKTLGLINQQSLLNDLKTLSDDKMQGRKVGSSGNKLAREFIAERFSQIGLSHYSADYFQPFNYGWNDAKQGANIISFIQGSDKPNKFIVITAHYDHIGFDGRNIFNGTDDNASGVSAMLNIAEYLKHHNSHHSIIFVATDAEEAGIHGAKAFIARPPISLDKIKYNLNLDMVSRGGENNTLYVAGTRKNNFLKNIITQSSLNAGVCLKTGHEGTRITRDDFPRQITWSKVSDHQPFIKNNIDYLYFGVDKHIDYHQTTDTFDRVDPQFYTASVETILSVLLKLDSI